MGVIYSALFGSPDDDHIDHTALKNASSAEIWASEAIYYGDDGNLRYGRKPRDRKAELLQFGRVDDPTEKHGKRWFIVDACWMENWLTFLTGSTEDFAVPDPGPCNNMRLLQHAPTYDKWIARDGVKAATQDVGGDYRRVTEETWKLYCKLYPGSGPAIELVTILPELEEKPVDDVETAFDSDDEDEGANAREEIEERELQKETTRELEDGNLGDTDEVDAFSPTLWKIDQTKYTQPPNVKQLLAKVAALKQVKEEKAEMEQEMADREAQLNRANDSDDEEERGAIRDSDDEDGEECSEEVSEESDEED